jgi:hypothetical protein
MIKFSFSIIVVVEFIQTESMSTSFLKHWKKLYVRKLRFINLLTKKVYGGRDVQATCKNLAESLSGTVVNIEGQERAIVGFCDNILWTCSPNEYVSNCMRLCPYWITPKELLGLSVVKKL